MGSGVLAFPIARIRKFTLTKHKAYPMIVPFLTALSAATSSAQNEERDPEARLAELGITLRKASSPVANYVNAVRTGDLLFLSGKVPLRADGTMVTGKVGADLSVEEGYEAARLAGVQLISTLKDELGDLGRVRRVVKALGMVNAAPDFGQHPAVINGFSDLMVAVFGDRGRHARSAIGMGSLPDNVAVEIELIVEVG